jgi:hypothetical protein
MFLSTATTHQPTIDLGYLLNKNPGHVHEIEQTFGQARVGVAKQPSMLIPLVWFGERVTLKVCSLNM